MVTSNKFDKMANKNQLDNMFPVISRQREITRIRSSARMPLTHFDLTRIDVTVNSHKRASVQKTRNER